MKRVLVTGANGFVGARVCRELLAAGWQVRAAVRRETALTTLAEGVEPVLFPWEADEESSLEVLDGVEAVVHLVARTHVLRESASDPLELYRSVNVGLTRRLLGLCRKSHVKRFVYLSSIKAVGEGSEQPYTERTPCQPQDAYGISKREAEELVTQAELQGWLETVIIRPPLVYGSGVKGNFLRLLQAVDKGIPLPLGRVRNHRTMIYVGNLAQAIVNVLEHPAASGQVFHVADQITLSTPDLIRQLAKSLGRRPLLVPVPVSLLRLAGNYTGRGGEIRRLVGSLTLSTEKIARVLNWVPPYTVEQGLQETVHWYLTVRKDKGG